jgi:two-component system response regulator GlrR
MKEVKILLFDLDHASGLGKTVRGIFRSSANPCIQIEEAFMNASGTSIFDAKGAGCISLFNPNLIVLVLSSDAIKRAGALFQSLSRELIELPVMAVIDGESADKIIEILKLGVIDFITPPLRASDILPRIWRLLDRSRREEPLTRMLKEKLGLRQLIGKSPAFVAEINKISLVSRCDTKVLISGETGTGKELFARAIHYLSLRAGKPFIPVNCGAIPADLIENELFGHVEGAFTGASKMSHGLIREADGGTLFLDEIDCLQLPVQVKLLRFLQDKEYRQLGSSKTHRADVRVIAATNNDLEKAMSERKFRQDLFYRLNIFPIMLPPLRERREDIPLLAHHFLTKYAAEFKKNVADFTDDAMQKLMLHDWPGNVRELENIIERAVVVSGQGIIKNSGILLAGKESAARHESFQEAKSKVIKRFEIDYIQGLLCANQGNITKAAEAAQKNRRAFWELIRKYKIDVQSFTSHSL